MPPDPTQAAAYAPLRVASARMFLADIYEPARGRMLQARELAGALLAAGRRPDGARSRDTKRLRAVARSLGLPVSGRQPPDLMEKVAGILLADLGASVERLRAIDRAPAPLRRRWKAAGVLPAGVEVELSSTERLLAQEEVWENGPRSRARVLFEQGLRTALADAWGSSTVATAASDILFGTPRPANVTHGLSALKRYSVNVVVSSANPLLTQLLRLAAREPEAATYARAHGARAVSVSTLACPELEAGRRHLAVLGDPSVLPEALAGGMVDLALVDGRYVASLTGKSRDQHTELVITARTGAAHDLDSARRIVRRAIENYPNRDRKRARAPRTGGTLMAGFSDESLRLLAGSRFGTSLAALNERITGGQITGLAVLLDCGEGSDPARTAEIVRDLVARDILVLAFGCLARGGGDQGYLTGTTFDHAGPGLAAALESSGLPPVLHAGGTADISRALSIVTEMVAAGGLGDDIADLPALTVLPAYCATHLGLIVALVTSGLDVVVAQGGRFARPSVTLAALTREWPDLFGSRALFLDGPAEVAEQAAETISRRRRVLELDRFGAWAGAESTLPRGQRAGRA